MLEKFCAILDKSSPQSRDFSLARSHNGHAAKQALDHKQEPDAAESKLRQDLHAQHKSRIWEDIQSSTDSFDQSLLTLSSGALGLSLAFIKDIVPLKDAVWIALLFTSWIAFALCIVSTVASFLLSVKANKQQLGYIDENYIHRNDLALDKHKSSRYVKWLERCTWVGIILFVAGLFCTIIFACENVARLRMNENKGKSPLRIDAVQGGRQPVDMTPVAPGRPAPVTPAPTPQEQRGRQPMNMTPVVSAPLEKGRQPVSMTRVPLKEGRQPVKITPVKPAQPVQNPPPSQSQPTIGIGAGL